MTSSVSRNATAIGTADSASQALQIALLELGVAAERPGVKELLKSVIDAAIGRVSDLSLLARMAVDEVVLITGGRVRPMPSA